MGSARLDRERMLVSVLPEGGDGEQIVSAALVLPPELGIEALMEAHVLVHADFAIAVIDEDNAR